MARRRRSAPAPVLTFPIPVAPAHPTPELTAADVQAITDDVLEELLALAPILIQRKIAQRKAAKRDA